MAEYTTSKNAINRKNVGSVQSGGKFFLCHGFGDKSDLAVLDHKVIGRQAVLESFVACTNHKARRKFGRIAQDSLLGNRPSNRFFTFACDIDNVCHNGACGRHFSRSATVEEYVADGVAAYRNAVIDVFDGGKHIVVRNKVRGSDDVCTFVGADGATEKLQRTAETFGGGNIV